MKSFRIDDDLALSHDRIEEAVRNASKRKQSRDDVKRILDALEDSIGLIQDMILEDGYKPRKHKACVINETGPQKTRTIVKPDYYPEQIVHHVIVAALMDPITHGMTDFVLGSVPGRGAHLGKKYIEKWLRNDPAHTRIIGKLDIHHFFQSIDHDILRAWIYKKIRPGVIRDLCDIVIDAVEDGIPLGFYTSQWLANFLLQPLDHLIMNLPGVYHSTRYMDDIVIFGSNKKDIHQAMDVIDQYLWTELRLEVKKNWTVFRFEYTVTEIKITCHTMADLNRLNNSLTVKHRMKQYHGQTAVFISERSVPKCINVLKRYGAKTEKVSMTHGRPLDYMGFEFHREYTVMRKSIMVSCSHKAVQIKRSARINWVQAAGMLSYLGWIDSTNTYGYFLEYIKPNVEVRRLKRIVSNHQRRLNDEDRLSDKDRLTGDTAGGNRHHVKQEQGLPAEEYQADRADGRNVWRSCQPVAV